MAHALAGVVAKLRRSDEHLITLYRELVSYTNSRPYFLRGDSDAGDGKPGFTFHFRQEPPIHLSALIGDAVYNMRSALDYIAHELTVRNGAMPTRQTQFPIALTEDDFLNQAITLKKLNTVSGRMLKYVSAFQPYRMDSDGKARRHFLWQLAKLSNQDKHHTLALSAIAANVAAKFTHPDGREVVSEFKSHVLHDGDIVASMPIGFDHPKLKTHLKVTTHIAFKDAPLLDCEVAATLQSIREFIGEMIVPTVEPFFDQLPDDLRLTSHGIPPEMRPNDPALKAKRTVLPRMDGSGST